jgi:acylphosphatase
MASMKLKIKISGPKVHDVGYRYFLMSTAMACRIRLFEAHNMESSEGEEVQVYVDGDEEAVKGFLALAKAKRPARSEVSSIVFNDFEGEVMKIGDYAQFCSTVQLNKAIPLLLDMRDDLKEMKGDMKEMKGDMKEMKGDMKEMKGDMKEMKGDMKEMKGDMKELKGDMKEMKGDMKAVRRSTEATLEEIKGMREDIQPGYGMNFRQVQADVRAIKERLGMQ